jgi:tetrachlorobenzoquinone reductase
MTEITLELRLTKVEYGSQDTSFFTLQDPDGGTLPDAEPGAHISLHLPSGASRQYSLVHAGQSLRSYVLGIKREAAGRGGSAYVHDKLRVGALLPVSPPQNNFPLNTAATSTVLVSGGIGVTPIICMAEHLAELGRPAQIHCAFRSAAEGIMVDHLTALGAQIHFDDAAGTVLDIGGIVRSAPRDAHLYCCGPAPMIDAFVTMARADGRDEDCIHVEYFASTKEAANEGGFEVVLHRSGQTVEVQPGESVLDAVRRAGAIVEARCQEGVCGACETTVLEGQPDHCDSILSPKERKANASMMICCSGSLSKRLVLDL